MTNAWALILAAGASQRFGGVKALALRQNKMLLVHSLTAAQAVTGPRVMTVIGCHADQIKPHLDDNLSVVNKDWPLGMGSSIAFGVRAILDRDASVTVILILLVDQPLVTPDHLRLLLASALENDRCALSDDGTVSGPPAAIPKRFFPMLMILETDQGLKFQLGSNDILKVYTASAMRDADTPEELQKLLDE